MIDPVAPLPGPGAASCRPPPHLQWRSEALWQQLEPYLPGLSVEVLARVESTNTLLLDRARHGSGRRDALVTTPGELQALHVQGSSRVAGQDDAGPYGRRVGDTQPCLLVAENQTLGRGRHGRSWQAGPQSSLTFSLALPLAPHDWSGLSLAVGVALADALEPPEPGRQPRLQLKWPNDLWLADPEAAGGGRKLGGVLIETVAVGKQRMVVVGLGLNIAALAPALPRDLASGYAWLQEIDAATDACTALHRVALPLVKALQQFEREGFAGFAPAYARRDLLRGRLVTTYDPVQGDILLEGRAEGVSGSGSLLLRVGSSLRLVASGEVSVRVLGSEAAAHTSDRA